MSKNGPFLCRWSDAHSEPQYFNTQLDLENHVFREHIKPADLSCFIRGRRVYRCAWEDCKKKLSSNDELQQHLWDHTYQKTFKCPICNNSLRFLSSDELHHHLIYRHNDSVMDYTGANDLTKKKKDNQGDTSEDEDYKNYRDKLRNERYYGKTEDEIIYEALCSYSDPKLVEKVEAGFKAIEDRDYEESEDEESENEDNVDVTELCEPCVTEANIGKALTSNEWMKVQPIF